ncbi:MAG: ABC transporter permease [Desulfovibrionaceae bacterium]
MDLRLAWRNIWRNPKRTVVILTAVVIGVWTMLFMVALTRGMTKGMLDNAISDLTGHIQIHATGYFDDPVVENALNDPETVLAAMNQHLPPGSARALRIRVGSVASNARHSAGLVLVGIEPGKEEALSFYGNTPLQGTHLEPGDARGILVGAALARDFETEVGKKLVLMSQGLDRDIASRAFRIRGLLHADLEATEKGYVFITLDAAREMLGLESATGACALLPDPEQADSVAAAIQADLGPGYEVRPWRKMLPLLVGYLNLFDRFLYLWYLIIFTAMGFGIVNTLLMAVLERIREYGLLKSLGMRPMRIVRGVLIEALLLMLFGTLMGDLLCLATVWSLSGGIDLSFISQGSQYFGMSRVIIPLARPMDMLEGNAVVLVLGSLVSLYPALKAARITPVQAMAHN